MSSRQHITFLDGLRGIAALSVTIYHVSIGLKGSWFSYGPLAVDFFFILSGFVVALAYEGRLLDGMSAGTFAQARTRRLYPMIVLGTVAGFIWVLAQYGADSVMQPAGVAALVFSLLLLPFGSFPAGSITAFPLNPPTWSLFYEAAINVFYGLASRWLTNKVVWCIVIVAGLGLALYTTKHHTLNNGWARNDFPIATVRVAFGFFAGVLLWRYHQKGGTRSSGWPIALLLTGILALPHSRWDGAIELIAVLAVFPTMIWYAAAAQPGPRASAFYDYIGGLSYPMYLLHYPIAKLALVYQEGYRLSGFWLGVSVLAEVLAIVLLSHLALRYYDKPAREWLRRRRPSLRNLNRSAR